LEINNIGALIFEAGKYGMSDEVDEVIYRLCGQGKGGCGDWD
jgi:hypothetical protein